MTNRDDAALDERDERVRGILLDAIAFKNDLASQMRRDAQELERDVRQIEVAAQREAWHLLEDYLSDADIESLCAVSPAGLLDRNDE